MCGILGGNCEKWDYKSGIISMKHRGPNGQRVVEFQKFALAFARLSIIDLSEKGMQPMFSDNEDVCIVFNGEIYGYLELRKQLILLGYKFNSKTDTEVIINAYLEFGDGFIDRIDGMFAIAIYDLRIQKIKLFRDRTGIKPLYYFFNGKQFGFASELKGLTNMCKNEKFQIDYTAIYDFLTYTYIPEPKTMYKNVFKLQPAHELIFDIKNNKIISNKKYWDLEVNNERKQCRRKVEIEEQLQFLIKKAVTEQLVSDVSIGSFLSGGIDSSIISYEVYKNNSKLESFSMGFIEKKYDEIEYALKLTERYKMKNNIEYMNKKEFEKIYHNLPDWYDEPFADTTAYANYQISRMAKEKVSVVLTGDGGDEVFGGYTRYQNFVKYFEDRPIHIELFGKIYENFLCQNKTTYKIFEKIIAEDIVIYGSQSGYLRKYQKQVYANEWNINKDYDDFWFFRENYKKNLPLLTRLQYLDLKTYLPGAILTKVDRAAMQTSLETRVPFLSRELIEFSFGLSQEDRCPNGVLKGLLKNAYKNIIPDEILNRKKAGFTVPPQYYRKNKSSQENLLKDLWRIG